MRRATLLTLMTSLACAAPASEPPPSAPAGVVRPRNVLMLTVDTLRADHIGAYGGAPKTPAMDALAARGWLFEECWAATMLTNPSHASIMTSLYPRDHGVYDNESGIQDGVRTLAAALRRHGMRTSAVLAFPHLNPEVSNLGQGFERVIAATRQERRADAQARLALQTVDELGEGESFFVWLHLGDVHAPYEPLSAPPPAPGPRTPIARAARVAPGFQKNNPWFKEAFRRFTHVEELTARYRAEVEETDAAIGRLLEGLRERGRLDDTLVVLTADHGESLGEHDLWFHHGGLYRETLHVPLIVATRGLSPSRDRRLVEHVDIAPTILDLVGAPKWEPMRGRSLVAQRRGELPGRAYAVSEHMQAQLIAVRDREATLIVHRKSSKQFPSYTLTAGHRELYDRAADPGEETVLEAEGEAAERLDLAMQSYLGAGLAMTAKRGVSDRESLQALGYIDVR